jgi:hypothetical protein
LSPQLSRISLSPLALTAIFLSACHLFASDLQQPTPRDLARARGFRWVNDSSEHFLLHIEQGSALEHRRDLLKVRLETMRRRVLTRIGEQDYATPIHVFVVGARARMRPLVGRSTNAIAFHRSHVMVMVVTENWGAAAAHELFHIFAMNLWGVGPVWLNEGLGVYMDGQWLGNDLHATAAYLADQDALIPFDRLRKDFRDGDELVSYPQVGSFARYLFERYRLDAVKALWRNDVTEFERIAGTTLSQAEQSWREFLTTVAATKVRYPAFERRRSTQSKPRSQDVLPE